MAKQPLDLVVHLGDYIYEGKAGKAKAGFSKERLHTGGEIKTLEDYRNRHSPL